MKSVRKRFMASGLASLALAVAVPSHAASLSFTMGGTSSTPAEFNGVSIANLSIQDIVIGSGIGTKWTLSAVYPGSYTSAFINALDFRYVPPPALTLSNFNQLGTSNVTLPTLGFNSGNNSTMANSSVNFQTSNRGDGAGRFTTGESVSWEFAGTSTSQFSVFDTHVNAIYNGGSVTFGVISAVPEPETYAMLLVGLGVIGLYVSRRKNRNFKNAEFAC